jgi:hypothetical protein
VIIVELTVDVYVERWFADQLLHDPAEHELYVNVTKIRVANLYCKLARKLRMLDRHFLSTLEKLRVHSLTDGAGH